MEAELKEVRDRIAWRSRGGRGVPAPAGTAVGAPSLPLQEGGNSHPDPVPSAPASVDDSSDSEDSAVEAVAYADDVAAPQLRAAPLPHVSP